MKKGKKALEDYSPLPFSPPPTLTSSSPTKTSLYSPLHFNPLTKLLFSLNLLLLLHLNPLETTPLELDVLRILMLNA